MHQKLSELKQIVVMAESQRESLVLTKLSYDHDDLSPVLSKEALEYHRDLANAYVDRYNKGEGDDKFNQAGAFLHNIFFPQLKSPSNGNRPRGVSLEFIDQHFQGGFDEFKDEFFKVAMSIQGSGWIYLSRNGTIKTIKNHEIRQDIVLLIDWWEHAFNIDYKTDKKRYLNNIWRIINWSVVDDRINLIK